MFSFAAIESMYDRTITVNGVAKAFAMTGWRIGYIGAPEWIAKACNKLQGQITSGANCIAQRATIAALDAPVSKIQYMVDEFHKRRDIVLELLREIDGFKCKYSRWCILCFSRCFFFLWKRQLKDIKLKMQLIFLCFY